MSPSVHSKHPMIGILTYGSLVQNPGPEIADASAGRIEGVATPFAVEYARSSSVRDGAPTLVPVERGGCRVGGTVYTLDDGIELEQAMDMLWRRETRSEQGEYTRPDPMGPDSVVIRSAPTLATELDCECIIYTLMRPNIDRLSPKRLAGLAIRSALASAGSEGQDGISYLADMKSAGISTPLSEPYEHEILTRMASDNLSEARAKLVGHETGTE